MNSSSSMGSLEAAFAGREHLHSEPLHTDLSFAHQRTEMLYIERVMTPKWLLLDHAWSALQVLSPTLVMLKIWREAPPGLLAALAACSALFALRCCMARRLTCGTYLRWPWLRPLMIFATDTLQLALAESCYHLVLPPPPLEAGLSPGRQALQLTVLNPACWLAMVAVANQLLFNQHLLVHTLHTAIVLSATRQHCAAGGGFERAYARLLRLPPVEDKEAATARCTYCQAFAVLAFGFVLPTCWLVLSELRSRCTFFKAAASHRRRQGRRRRGQQPGLQGVGSATMWLGECVLTLVPIVAVLSSVCLKVDSWRMWEH